MSSTTWYMTDIPIRNNALDESRRASEPIRIAPTVSATKLLQTAPTISSPQHLGFWCSGVGVGWWLMLISMATNESPKGVGCLMCLCRAQSTRPTRMNPRGTNFVLTKLRTNENWRWDATNDITLCMVHRRCPSSPQSLPQFLGIESENKNHVLSPANLTSGRRRGPRFPRIAWAANLPPTTDHSDFFKNVFFFWKK